MTRPLRLALVALLAALQTFSEGTQAQPMPGIPGVEKGAWTIRLIRLERSGSDWGDYSFTFQAENRQTGEQKTVKLGNETAEIEGLEVTDDLLVVLGSAGGAADVVSVFDLRNGSLIDSFLCWTPKLSATGRYVGAVRFVPRFADPALASDVVVLFDLHGVRSDGPRGDARLQSIFPEEALGPASSEIPPIENEVDRHEIGPAGWLWEPEDRRVVFIDRTKNNTFLIAVDLTQPPVIRRHALDVASLLSLPPDAPRYAEVLAQERAGVPAVSLRWLSPGRRVGVEVDPKLSANASAYRGTDPLLLEVELEELPQGAQGSR